MSNYDENYSDENYIRINWLPLQMDANKITYSSPFPPDHNNESISKTKYCFITFMFSKYTFYWRVDSFFTAYQPFAIYLKPDNNFKL